MLYVRRLTWDPGNVAHIARHNITPDEVEQVCHGEPIIRQSYLGRLLVIGPNHASRILLVVLDPEGDDAYYVVTARPADRKERRTFQAEKGGETS